MSYDLELYDPATGEILELDEPHHLRGGTYTLGGTMLCEFNIAYNYWPHFKRVLGEKGVRAIHGMTGAESLPLLEQAMASLGDDVDDDYWKPTEGNAKRALVALSLLARVRPDGVWRGD